MMLTRRQPSRRKSNYVLWKGKAEKKEAPVTIRASFSYEMIEIINNCGLLRGFHFRHDSHHLI